MVQHIRINEELFEFEGDQAFYNGVPFAGIGFLLGPNSQLLREFSYKDGFPEGLCRRWYSNGQLMSEWNAIGGQATGKVYEWHENGIIKLSADYEYGAALSYDEWNSNGELIANHRIDTKSELFKYVEEMRRRNRK